MGRVKSNEQDNGAVEKQGLAGAWGRLWRETGCQSLSRSRFGEGLDSGRQGKRCRDLLLIAKVP